MKWQVWMAAAMVGVLSVFVGCQQTPVQPVAVPRPDDPTAYRPIPQPKPMPGVGEIPGIQPGYGGNQPAGGGGVGPAPALPYEDAFLQAYARHNARMMIFVNRTIEGESLPGDQLDQIIRSQNQSSVGLDPTLHITSTDYAMIEASMVRYFDNSGKVKVQDSDAARAKLNREQVLRIENGDPAANRLLATELQTDVLVRVSANPTTQSGGGAAVRLVAKAVSTTDARILATEFVDMPLPMTKPNVDADCAYLVSHLMGSMAQKWSLPAQYDPIEVRIYKAGSVDDALKVAKWLQSTQGVQSVGQPRATGGSTTAYAVVDVGYAGAPWALYDNLKAAIGLSQGLKAVDMQNNTINLEITGPMNLVTTTRAVESTTTIETRTTEERKIEPINPAGTPK